MKKGFTLVELLIVIILLAILSGVLMYLINPAAIMAKGRDAQRIQDVETLAKALILARDAGELTYVSTETCTDCTSATGQSAVDGTSGWVKFTIPSGKTGLTKYIPDLPLDPVNTSVYVYYFGSKTAGFEIDAVLESPDNLTKMTTDGGNAQDRYEVGTDLTIL